MKIRCEYCGQRNDAERDDCRFCGGRLSDNKRPIVVKCPERTVNQTVVLTWTSDSTTKPIGYYYGKPVYNWDIELLSDPNFLVLGSYDDLGQDSNTVYHTE